MPPTNSNRREFLTGRAAADALVDAVDRISAGGSEASSLPQPGPSHYLLRLARQAMACQFEVLLNAGQHERGPDVALEALDLVDELEDQLSVYRESSEISRLNAAAANAPVQVESRLFALLEDAARLNRETDGAFDITAGPLSRAWGFTRRSGAIPAQAAIDRALAQVGGRWVQLDAATRSVRFARAGVEINLGAIGKGFALDRCAELLDAAAIGDYLLHGGNSSVLARGSKGGDPEGGWSIGLRNPLRPMQRLGELRLEDRALATSGSGTQYFIHKGRRYGHLLDPRSGWPAEGTLSATAIAPTAAAADALSTAFYVLGVDAACRFCLAHADISAILVTPGKFAGDVEVHTLGDLGDTWSPGESSAT